MTIAVGVIAAGLFALFAYAGHWPPIVVVESNSMMHVVVAEYNCRPVRNCEPGDTREPGVPYGRFGTIDPGDIVVVKRTGRASEIQTFADGGKEHYGLPGEVVVYRPGGAEGTPIIHRAMTYVWVQQVSGVRTYSVKWADSWPVPATNATCAPPGAQNRTCLFTSQRGGVEIPALNIRGMQPTHSGLITKGDNRATNRFADQILFQEIRDQPVPTEWLDGVARGEVPWLGMLKLMLTTGGQPNCFGAVSYTHLTLPTNREV